MVERSADDVGLAASVLEELAEEYANFEPSSYASFPDNLLPKASIVVPTIYRRTDHLNRTVESLLALDYRTLRSSLWTIVPASTMIQYRSSRVTVASAWCWKPRSEVQAARNRGIAVTTGEFIAFTDDDVIVDRNWLRALGVRFALDEDVDAIVEWFAQRISKRDLSCGLRSSTAASRSHFWRESGAPRSSLTRTIIPLLCRTLRAGCNMAVRRSAFQRYGGFDVRVGIGTKAKSAEDLKVFINILLGGGTVAYEPTALVRHSHRRSSHEFMMPGLRLRNRVDGNVHVARSR